MNAIWMASSILEIRIVGLGTKEKERHKKKTRTTKIQSSEIFSMNIRWIANCFSYQELESRMILGIPFEINKCLQCCYSKQAE